MGKLIMEVSRRTTIPPGYWGNTPSPLGRTLEDLPKGYLNVQGLPCRPESVFLKILQELSSAETQQISG